MSEAVLRVKDLCVDFRTGLGWVNIVDRVSFDVRRGESVGVVGESGSGKSVTSLAIMGLIDKPAGRIRSGSIELDGQELVGAKERTLQNVRGSQIAMIQAVWQRSQYIVIGCIAGNRFGHPLMIHSNLKALGRGQLTAEACDPGVWLESVRKEAEYSALFVGNIG